MPRGDGTGPAGAGPMTGRGAGYCAGYGVPGFMNGAPTGGFGGWWRHGFHATGLPGWARGGVWGGFWDAAPRTPDPQIQQNALKEQAEYLQQSLEAINKRISELEHKTE